jgi:hypothetical protein
MSSNKTPCPICGKLFLPCGLRQHLRHIDACLEAISQSQYQHEHPLDEVIAGRNVSNAVHGEREVAYCVDLSNLPIDHPNWNNEYYESLNDAGKAQFCIIFERHLYHQVDHNGSDAVSVDAVIGNDDYIAAEFEIVHASGSDTTNDAGPDGAQDEPHYFSAGMDVLGQHPDAFPAHHSDDSDKETPLVDENADLPTKKQKVLSIF